MAVVRNRNNHQKAQHPQKVLSVDAGFAIIPTYDFLTGYNSDFYDLSCPADSKFQICIAGVCDSWLAR